MPSTTALLDDLAARCAALVDDGTVQARAGDRLAAVGPHRPHRRSHRAQPVRQQLPRAGRSSRRDRSRPPRPRHVRLRHGVGAVHLRHPDRPQGTGVRAQPVPRHRRHDPVLVVLRRQRRSLRDDPRRAGLRDQRCAQPRVDHRRHPPVQGPSAAVRQQRHGAAGATAAGGVRRPLPVDRHRWRVLDGRCDRRPGGDLRPGRPVRRDGDGRRLACRRLRRSRAAAAHRRTAA